MDIDPQEKCCINCYFCSRTFQEIPVTYLCFRDILKRHKSEPVIVSEDYSCEHFIHNEEVE